MLEEYHLTYYEYSSINDILINGKYIVKDTGIFYWECGKRHRLNGPACEWYDGEKYWIINGKTHRLDGPAIEYHNGIKFWQVNDIYHRLDGPALEWANGTVEYVINDHTFDTKEEYEIAVYLYKNNLESYI